MLRLSAALQVFCKRARQDSNLLRRIRSPEYCILVRTDASGNVAVLQDFSGIAVERLSVAYWLILARLQYGCSTAAGQ